MRRREPHRLGVDPHPWNDWSPAQRRAAVLRVLRRYDPNRVDDRGHRDRRNGGLTAEEVARMIGVPSARRAGRGAVAGSWSGYMAAGLRVVPALRSAAAAGLVGVMSDWTRYRYVSMYFLSASGEKERDDEEAVADREAPGERCVVADRGSVVSDEGAGGGEGR